MKHLLFPVLLLFLGTSAMAEASDPTAPPTRSFETSLSGLYSYRDDFGGLGAAPGVGFTYGYAIGPHSQLGVTLLRFQPWLATSQSLMEFAYGLEYKHFWDQKWADLGPWQPWVSYSLLLDQALRQNVSGRGMAHDSRVALGTDLTVADRQRIFFETGWSMASFASFGVEKAPSISALSAGLGWRVLF